MSIVVIAIVALGGFILLSKLRRPPPSLTAVQATPLLPYQPAPVDPLSSLDAASAPYLREEIFRGMAKHQADKWWSDMAAAAEKLGPKSSTPPPPPPNA